MRSYGFGSPTDTPVPADYDGDGITDLGVFRPVNGWWYIEKSSTNYSGTTGAQFGGPSDVPVPADYDGDGKADLAVYRATAATWFIARTTTGTTQTVTGAGGGPTDTAVGNNLVGYAIANAPSETRKASDVDADRKIDPTVFRPSTGEWRSLTSTSGYAGVDRGRLWHERRRAGAGRFRRRRQDRRGGVSEWRVVHQAVVHRERADACVGRG